MDAIAVSLIVLFGVNLGFAAVLGIIMGRLQLLQATSSGTSIGKRSQTLTVAIIAVIL